jgi:GH25 family lysozyme M1 (1,4-beta-N-acetylmuramidase)
MIDVSQYQGHIEWPAVPRSMRALVRVTYGTTGIDSLGHANLTAARGTRHQAGGYHFLEDGSPTAEMENFLSHFTPQVGGLRGMIDVEPSAYSHPTSERVIGAVEAYRAHTGHDPIVYGTAEVLASLHLPPSLARCPLMLAGYGPNDGKQHPPGPPPPPWRTIAAHQYTSVGSCPGVTGHVDVSHIYDAAALTVPRPRRIVGTWRIAYIGPDSHPAVHISHFPFAWCSAHPRIKRRGAVTITPHRR